jgi:hypothetical protein
MTVAVSSNFEVAMGGFLLSLRCTTRKWCFSFNKKWTLKGKNWTLKAF